MVAINMGSAAIIGSMKLADRERVPTGACARRTVLGLNSAYGHARALQRH